MDFSIFAKFCKFCKLQICRKEWFKYLGRRCLDVIFKLLRPLNWNYVTIILHFYIDNFIWIELLSVDFETEIFDLWKVHTIDYIEINTFVLCISYICNSRKPMFSLTMAHIDLILIYTNIQKSSTWFQYS